MKQRQAHAYNLTALLEEHNVNGLEDFFNAMFHSFRCHVDFSRDSGRPLTFVIWKEVGRDLHIDLPINMHKAFPSRLQSLIDLFSVFEIDVERQGYLEINTSDAGQAPEMHFCGISDCEYLIPDSAFLHSRGYEDFRDAFVERNWSARSKKIFWRGSSTGQRVADDWRSLPRFQLCVVSRNDARFDCGLTEFVQVSAEERKALERENVLKDFVSPRNFDKYRYHLDIDGNSNAWAALFLKLLSGGVVLKVESPFGYRQWFYDQLLPWHNYVPIDNQFGNLIEAYERLEADPKLAEAIGRHGRALALSLDYESELRLAARKLTNQFLKGSRDVPAPTISTAGNPAGSYLAQRLHQAFLGACSMVGKLPESLLTLEGMSGKMYRLTINNLVGALPRARYLEVGAGTGSTVCSALYGNEAFALCIDNWSDGAGAKVDFLSNVRDFTGEHSAVELVEEDVRFVDFASIGLYNIYMYDGPHIELCQASHLLLPLIALEKEFVFIVDDWNWQDVRERTIKAIAACAVQKIFTIEVRTTFDNSHPRIGGQKSNWHNGCLFAVLHKV